jgi:hypothetical protein
MVDQCTGVGLINPDVHAGGGRYTSAGKCVDLRSLRPSSFTLRSFVFTRIPKYIDIWTKTK